jgi:hypothetical protein
MALAIAGGILYLVRRDHMRGPYAVWWIFAATAVAALGLFPREFDGFARLLGVAYPPTLFIVAALGLLLVKILTLDLGRSKQERKLRRLVQRLAILEARLDQHEAQQTSSQPPQERRKAS